MKEKTDMRKHRLTVEEWRMIRQLRKEADITVLKKPEPLKGNIHIVFPMHYGSQGMMWVDRFVTEGQLEGYKQQYPNLQIIERRDLGR
jgi:hypothetical protein